MLKQLTKEDCDITILIELDDIPVRGNAMASGDDSYDKEIEDEIISRVNDGDVWAWAFVIVRASWHNYSGQDSLGGCSYKNEEDFVNSDGYYEQMVTTAINDLNNNLAKMYEEIKPLDKDCDNSL